MEPGVSVGDSDNWQINTIHEFPHFPLHFTHERELPLCPPAPFLILSLFLPPCKRFLVPLFLPTVAVTFLTPNPNSRIPAWSVSLSRLVSLLTDGRFVYSPSPFP